jgi:hypothetical protein
VIQIILFSIKKTFFSDVTYLTSPPILATTEYSNLLRPLRGREPEGMWNLLQIVREMLARHDLNGTQLLDILTRQCLGQEQVKQLEKIEIPKIKFLILFRLFNGGLQQKFPMFIMNVVQMD